MGVQWFHTSSIWLPVSDHTAFISPWSVLSHHTSLAILSHHASPIFSSSPHHFSHQPLLAQVSEEAEEAFMSPLREIGHHLDTMQDQFLTEAGMAATHKSTAFEEAKQLKAALEKVQTEQAHLHASSPLLNKMLSLPDFATLLDASSCTCSGPAGNVSGPQS